MSLKGTKAIPKHPTKSRALLAKGKVQYQVHILQ